MKKKRKETEKRGSRVAAVAAPPARSHSRFWLYLAGFGAALAAAFAVYGPALHGPFVLDDIYLPFTSAAFAHQPLATWLRGVRPLLMFTFWANFRMSDLDPYSYHVVNLLLHVANAALLFFIVRRLLQWAGAAGRRLQIVAAFCAGLFLVHPVQTESVTYIASRSEALSLTFLFGALVVFVYRRSRAVSWAVAAATLALFAAAASTKEHTVALIGILLLTDYFWNPGFSFEGIRKNWRLYIPAVVAGGAAGVWVLRVLRTSDSAGFGLKEVTWHSYLFTQCRVIWSYIRLFVLPVGQTLDPDVPWSRTPLDHLAFLGMAALLAVTVAAFLWRKRYPLAAYGWFAFLILLAPTSSVVPLADPMAEHRLYLPFIGLLLIVAEVLRRVEAPDKTVAMLLVALLFAYGAAARARNGVWNSTIALWEDAAAKAPGKYRPHFQLGFAYFKAGRCADAIRQYDAAWRTGKHEGRLLADWGLAYDCDNQPDQAVAKLRQATALMQGRFLAHVYSLIGTIYGKQGKTEEALQALKTGEAVDPGAANIYVVRGHVFAHANRFREAAEQYRRALAVEPYNDAAARALRFVEAKLGPS